MIIAAPRASQQKAAPVESATRAQARAQRSLRRANHAPLPMTASTAKLASVAKVTNGAVLSQNGNSTATTVCTWDATRAAMKLRRI